MNEYIYSDYLIEKRKEVFYSRFILLLRYLSLISFIIMLIFYKGLEGKHALIGYLPIISGLAGMVCYKRFEIPEIILNLISKNPELSNISWKIIESRREEILLPFFKTIEGIGYDKNRINIKREELEILLFELERYNWKKIFPICFYIYTAIYISTVVFVFY